MTLLLKRPNPAARSARRTGITPPKAVRNVIQLGTDVSEVDASLRCGAGEGRIFTPSIGKREVQFDKAALVFVIRARSC
jgi:hypothetical protein